VTRLNSFLAEEELRLAEKARRAPLRSERVVSRPLSDRYAIADGSVTVTLQHLRMYNCMKYPERLLRQQGGCVFPRSVSPRLVIHARDSRSFHWLASRARESKKRFSRRDEERAESISNTTGHRARFSASFSPASRFPRATKQRPPSRRGKISHLALPRSSSAIPVSGLHFFTIPRLTCEQVPRAFGFTRHPIASHRPTPGSANLSLRRANNLTGESNYRALSQARFDSAERSSLTTAVREEFGRRRRGVNLSPDPSRTRVLGTFLLDGRLMSSTTRRHWRLSRASRGTLIIVEEIIGYVYCCRRAIVEHST